MLKLAGKTLVYDRAFSHNNILGAGLI